MFISFIVIGLFVVGIVAGSFFRGNKKFIALNEKLVSMVVFALLFFLGVSVGADTRVINNISTLGWKAIALSGGAISGSLLLSAMVSSFFTKDTNKGGKPDRENERVISIKLILNNQSIWILLFFIIGITGALNKIVPAYWGNSAVSTAILYIMMILVGAGIGSDPRALEILRSTRFHILIVPVVVIVGSLTGSLLISFLTPDINATNGMAIGAGFGYYSLSAIIIGKISGNEMGVIALLANIFREVFTLVAAPWLVRWFGKLGAIVSGGATAMDTTLPVIIKATGKEFAVISIFSGIVLSMLVPVLVPLLLGN
ncbi:MAG: hypothetical protein JG782_657 [Anaerophaga sp.]|uniref:lysine exporter LysO family protein n=1 Tax=Anaerophaga thermohalophila TaxID=177400 RepID=UPI000237CC94|nr:lysine exporter LysO family protein [Anaerophaga thermohalophila]MBZ4676038.1 hypothetical protein [Anaerophaga sp.]MDK2840960.1 hypothetical protein [Anaerophaga sp.]